MDYETRYKEARERASKLREQNPFDTTVGQMVDRIFPELKENEYEKIKFLIKGCVYASNITPEGRDEIFAWLEKQGSYIKLSNSAYTSNGDIIEFADKYSHTIWENLMDNFKKIENYSIGCNDVSDIVLNAIINTYNWLKKQGDNDVQVIFPTFTFDDVLALQCCMETVKKVREDKDLYEKLNDLHSRVYDAYHLEKQDEQKPYGQRKECFDCPSNYAGVCKGYCYIKRVEQKFTDKVEPKFHPGDWIIRNNQYTGIPIQVIEFKGYYCCKLNGEVFALSPNDVHNNFHLWTIQDAQEGDVLAINWHEGDDSWGKIIIFKKYRNKGLYSIPPSVEGYGNTFKNGKLAFHDEEVPYYSETWTCNLHPATKEQRDLLFRKMKEAGYEWDIEKKEPKKIEPKK